MTTGSRRGLVLEMAAEAGFDLAGLSPATPPPDAAHFESWLDEGLHGSMTWLERDRERILDPTRVIPGARSILVVGLGHSRAAVEAPGGGRIARYAAGRDYHNIMSKRLRKLGKALAREGLTQDWRQIVDAGPVLERSHAARAGLGFPSKAANLLHPRYGPWFFLGGILLEADLEPSPAPTPALGSCGTCTACLDACPTQAIVAPGRVDARRCISYQTIEHQGPIPRELRGDMGPWAFGCDVCSEVCPWGSDAPDLAQRFGTNTELRPGQETAPETAMVRWLTRPEGFEERFNGSPLRRPGREGLARNAALVLGNQPQEGGQVALLQALDQDPSPVVREAAAWSLGRAYGTAAGVRGRLERALQAEPDPEAARGISDTRDQLG